MVEKIELIKKYKFATFHSIFLNLVIDFKDKSTYFEYPLEKKLFERSEFCISRQSQDICSNSYDIFFNDKLNLSESKINSFLEEFYNLNLNGDVNLQKLHDIDNLYLYEIKIYSQNDEKILKRFDYSKDWEKFEEICYNLLGFDFFDSKGIITDYNFDIKRDGIYLNHKKLNLTKLYYHYFIAVAITNKEFIIDFDKKNIVVTESLGWDDTYSIELSDEDISQLFTLFEKYGVYEWCHVYYYGRLTSKEGWAMTFDGYRYFIELIFNDKYVMVIGGHCEHPDTYFNFGKEIVDLLGLDLFNISDISNEEEYLSWADKHLIV